MLMHSRPGTRLITQNLLGSADLYETDSSVDWASIYDLCVLINLFCLYDNVVVIGREATSKYIIQNPQSELLSLLADSRFVSVEDFVGKKKEKVLKDVSQAARGHLRALLAESDDPDHYERLVRRCLQPSAVEYGLKSTPDRGRDFMTIGAWLRTAPSRRDILSELEKKSNFVRAYTFVVRTFLYLAYANTQTLMFTPDATRENMLGPIIDAEQSLRTKLLKKLRGTSQKQLVVSDFSVKIAPFAAIVFDRAKRRGDISREMERLRKELAPLRERLRGAEETAWKSDPEQQKAEQKWRQVFVEIERTFGKGEALFSIRNVLNFAGTAGEAIDEPHKKGKWAKALASLPVEILLRILDRQPAIEIHRLREAIPATEKLRMKINYLFGDVKEDRH
jgi:hypothetical protein